MAAKSETIMRKQWDRRSKMVAARHSPKRIDLNLQRVSACMKQLPASGHWLPGPTLLTSPTLYCAFSSVRVTPTCISRLRRLSCREVNHAVHRAFAG